MQNRNKRRREEIIDHSHAIINELKKTCDRITLRSSNLQKEANQFSNNLSSEQSNVRVDVEIPEAASSRQAYYPESKLLLAGKSMNSSSKPNSQDSTMNIPILTGIEDTKTIRLIDSELALQKASSTSAHLSPPTSTPLNVLNSIYQNQNHSTQALITKPSMLATSTPLTSLKHNPLLKALSEEQSAITSSQVPSTQSFAGSNITPPNSSQACNNSLLVFPIPSGSNLSSSGSLIPNPQPNSSFVAAGVDLMLTSTSQRAVLTDSRDIAYDSHQQYSGLRQEKQLPYGDLSQQNPHQLPQQPHQNEVQSQNQIAAAVSKVRPIEEVVQSSAQISPATVTANSGKELVDSIILPTTLMAAQSIGGVDRREPQKAGGKGTFSSISAVAAAAGHVNPLLNSSPSSNDRVPMKTIGGPTHPGFNGNGLTNGSQNLAQSRGSSEALNEISLPAHGVGGRQPLAASNSTILENNNTLAVNAQKTVTSQYSMSQKGIASQKGEVKPLRINLSKAQREKSKDKKIKEDQEKESDKEIEKQRDKVKEQEKEKVDDREKFLEKERDPLRQQTLAITSAVSEVLTYENLKLGNIATLSKMRDLAAAKLSALERKTMLEIKGPPPYLPRPKSHWDYLMDEMQWMAIDFRQERRLKIAHCGVVSRLCADAATKTFGYSGDLKSRSDSSNGIYSGERNLKNAIECGGICTYPDECQLDIEEATMDDHYIKKKAYRDTAVVDIVVQRKFLCAKISTMVRNKWQSLEETFSVHGKEVKELLKICRAADDADDFLLPPSVKSEANNFIIRENEREAFVQYLERTQHVLSAEGCKDLNFDCNLSSSFKNGESTPLSHTSGLNTSQQEALENIIFLNKLGYGALLHGKQCSGKTVTCAFAVNSWLQIASTYNQEASGSKVHLGKIKLEDKIYSEMLPYVAADNVFDNIRPIRVSYKKKPVLVVTPRCSLIKWLAELSYINHGLKVQLWASSQEKSSCSFENNVKNNGSCDSSQNNSSHVTLQSDSKEELDTTDDNPDVLICTLEHLHLFLESEKVKCELSDPSQDRNKDQKWSGIIVDIRGLNTEALNSSLLLSKRRVEEEMAVACQRNKDLIDVKVNIPSSSSTSSATGYFIPAKSIGLSVNLTEAIGGNPKGEEKHWLCLLSEKLSPSIHNRCFISDDDSFDKNFTNGLLSFLLPQTSSIFPGGFPSSYNEIFPSRKDDIIKRLNVELKVKPHAYTINEEILTVDMGPIQYRKYSIVIDYLLALEVFQGSDINNVAKALVVLRRLCFHEDMVCISIQGDKDDRHICRVGMPSIQAAATKREPVIFKDENECQLGSKDTSNGISSIHGMQCEVKEETYLADSKSKSSNYPDDGEVSYRNVTSPAYTCHEEQQHLRLGGGCLSAKLNCPLTFDMSQRSNNTSTSHISASCDPSNNAYECIGSCKLQALTGLLDRFADSRVVVTAETAEELLVVHRFLAQMEVDHLFIGMEYDISEATMKDDSNCSRDVDRDDFSFIGLEGGVGKGLGWLRGQGIMNAFNLKSGKALILVTNDIFRTKGCLSPRRTDAVIVLSENCILNSNELSDCLSSKLIAESQNQEYNKPLTIVRLAARGTLEEAIIRRGGSFMALQGLMLKEIGLGLRDTSISPVHSSIVRDSSDLPINESSIEDHPFPLIKDRNNDIMDAAVFLISAPFLHLNIIDPDQAERWTKSLQAASKSIDLSFGVSKNYVEFTSVSSQIPSALDSDSLLPSAGVSVPSPSLVLAPAVKRSYLPRKKSEGSFDSTGEISINTSSLIKTDQKRDKKKSNFGSINNFSSSSLASLSSSIPPWKADEVAIPEEQSQFSHYQTTETLSNSYNVEDEVIYESCWAADRLAETILSSSLSINEKAKKRTNNSLSSGDDLTVLGLSLRMAYTVSRNWQHNEDVVNEDTIAGTLPNKIMTPIGITANSPLSSVASPTPSSSSVTAASSASSNMNICREQTPFVSTDTNAPLLSAKVKVEPVSLANNPKIDEDGDWRSRLNWNYLSELDRLRLRRAGVGVSKAEKVFWSLMEPFVNIPVDRPKEVQKVRLPGQFVANNLPGSIMLPQATSLPQPCSAISFQESIRELKRKGVPVDSHMYVHPLQNAMRSDLQLIPSWQRKGTASDTHGQFTIQYMSPRLHTSKTSSLVSKKARGGGGGGNITTRGVEREKEPVRKRVLDQAMLISNIRTLRAKLETGVASRPSSLGGTVNPLFTRLPPIRTVLKPRPTTDSDMRSLRWTEAEDSIIAVVNYLYKDPYGLVMQKALENHRPFPFQSSIIAPSGLSSSQERSKVENLGSSDSNPAPFSFPIRTVKQILDRVLWQQRNPQDSTFGKEEITTHPRFTEHLKEFSDWKTNDRNRRVPNRGAEKDSILSVKQEKNQTTDIDKNKDENSIMHIEVEGAAIKLGLNVEEERGSSSCHWDGKNEIFFSSGAKRSWWGLSHSHESSARTNNQLPATSVTGEVGPKLDVDHAMDVENHCDTELKEVGSRSAPQEMSHLHTVHQGNDTVGNAIYRIGAVVTKRLFACSTDSVGRGSSSETADFNATIGGFLKNSIEESERQRPTPPPMPGISLPFSMSQSPPLMRSDSDGDMSDQTVMVVRHGMGKGMGKGGKGAIAKMGFAHPSHRLALLSAQVSQTLPPYKIVQKMKADRIEETRRMLDDAKARIQVEVEEEMIRQEQLQVQDEQHQIHIAIAQAVASQSRINQKLSLYTSNPNTPSLVGSAVQPGGAKHPVINVGSNNVPKHSSPSLTSFSTGSQPMTGVHYQPSSEPGVASGQGPGQGQGGKGDSMYNHNSNSVTEKEGYIKPLTAAAIMSTTATRVSSTTAPPISFQGHPNPLNAHNISLQQQQHRNPQNPHLNALNQPPTQPQPYHPSSSGYPNSYLQEHQQPSSLPLPPRPPQFQQQQQQQQQNKPVMLPLQQSVQNQNQSNNIHAILQNSSTVQNNGGLNGGLSGATASRPVGAEDLTQLRNYTAPSTGEGVVASQGSTGQRGSRLSSNTSWTSEEMQRMLASRPDVKAQAQAIMSCRTLQDADKKTQIRDLLKKLRESIMTGTSTGGGASEGEASSIDVSPKTSGSETATPPPIPIETVNSIPISIERIQPQLPKDSSLMDTT